MNALNALAGFLVGVPVGAAAGAIITLRVLTWCGGRILAATARAQRDKGLGS